MAVTRDVGDISTSPGGKSGAEWTTDVRYSLSALWGLSGGMITITAGTNALTASIPVSGGFSAYTDGLRVGFIPLNSNTGAMTLNIAALGAKAILDANGDPAPPGSVISGRLAEVVFSTEDDAFRLVSGSGTTNVTLEGGLLRRRTAPMRLAAAAGPSTGEVTTGSIAFQCDDPDSRVIVEGNVTRVTGAGSPDVTGTQIRLYVDGVLTQSFTDHCAASQQASTPVYFSYSPGDIDSHTYQIRVVSALAATYPVGSNVMWISEVSPNP